jgi:fructan beta-fructosidase
MVHNSHAPSGRISSPQALIIPLVVFILYGCTETKVIGTREPHRPYVHFTPAAKWMNDPNGLVLYKNTYHLFYQYYPDSTVWGPMHWAHATSSDLVHWQHQPIALYPDSLGYIFSGSAVADIDNTSGFGRNGQIPLVAIFTHHDTAGEKRGTSDFQYQSIAYSLDEGKSWTKYAGNPVLKNPGIRDFRDPKVSWYDAGKKWIMTLATLDRITFYSSPDLKNWQRESEFGKEAGAHGGVWECPDLFQLSNGRDSAWILIVSINPGGPNGGSATQYFVGNFDGKEFIASDTLTRWIDFGPDNYAGITWANTGDRKIFIGWMSNWQYARLVPTGSWRGAATLPRDLSIVNVEGRHYVASTPSEELRKLEREKIKTTKEGSVTTARIDGAVRVELSTAELKNFTISLANSINQELKIGFDSASNSYYIDRSRSGNVQFEKGFGARHTAPRISVSKSDSITLIIDNSSVELFAGQGLGVLTSIFFPDEEFNSLRIDGEFDQVDITELVVGQGGS